MKFENYKILIFLILPFLSVSCGGSNPYMKGGIKFISKNNAPCLYIDEDNFIGDYTVSISQYQMPEPIFGYASQFKKNYPKKDNCLIINNKNFNNLKLKLNTPYDIQFEIASPGKDSVFRTAIFCIRSDQGRRIMQRFDGFKCSDIPAEETTK